LGTVSTIFGRRSPSGGGSMPAKAVHVKTNRQNKAGKILTALFKVDSLLLKIVVDKII
jgi:hypothetical protein